MYMHPVIEVDEIHHGHDEQSHSPIGAMARGASQASHSRSDNKVRERPFIARGQTCLRDCPSARETTSDTRPVFRATYRHPPTAMVTAVEFDPTSASTACEAQNAAAVQTVRHAPLNKTCTGFGRCSGFQSDWTSAPPRPIITVSLKLKRIVPARMKTKFVDIVVFSPGRRIFIAEATIASARNRTK